MIAVAVLLTGLLLLWLLVMSGFTTVSVLSLIFFIYLFGEYRRSNLKTKRKIGAALFITSIALSGCLCWSAFHNRNTRRPDRYLIPQGYVGWVIIEYKVKKAPPLLIEDGHNLYKIPRDGRFLTASPLEDGIASDDYFYVTPKGRQVIESTGWGEGGLIWGGSTGDGSISVGDAKGTKEIQTPPTLTFFVGTEKQFQNAGAEPTSKQMQKVIESN